MKGTHYTKEINNKKYIYSNKDELGCGTFGSVYKGQWKKAGKTHDVAIKVVSKDHKELAGFNKDQVIQS